MNVAVRGHSRRSTESSKTSTTTRLLASGCDLLFAAILTESLYVSFKIALVPDLKLLLIFAFCWIFPLILGRIRLMMFSAPGLSASFGEWLWGIERVGENRTPQSLEKNYGIFLTALLSLISVLIFEAKIADTPEWVKGSEVSIQAVVPPSDWRVLAFHYSLAAWPKPEGYFMPYEFGPPKRFVGKIEARWNESRGYNDEKLVFEGPKTPFPFQSQEVTRKQLRDCVIGSPSFHCAAIRELSLERPLEEMRKLGFSKFKLKWFTSVNPAIPLEERAQGILLSGVGGGENRRYQDRYILVSEKGMHQALIFSYLNADSPEKMKIALGTLRFSDDLGPGRAWVDSELEGMQLAELPPPSDPAYLPKLIEAEGLLVSKISVEPAPIETYFHLAGIQAMLLEYGKKNHRTDLVDDAKQMLEQVSHFSQDIAVQFAANSPAAHQAHEIEKLWHDSLQF